MTEIEKPALERKIWGPWATIGFGLVIFAVFFTVQSLALIAVIFPNLLPLLQSSAGQMVPFELMHAIEELLATQMGFITSVSVCVSAVFGVGFIMLFSGIRKGVSIAEYLGLRRITTKQILGALGLTVVFMFLTDFAGIFVDTSASNEYMLNIYNTSVWPWLLWVSLIIFAPIFEETFFRGFLFEGFRQSRLGAVGAIGLTAIVWAIMHVQYGLYEIVTIVIIGIIFGIVRLRTRSLWSPMLMHAFINLVATVEAPDIVHVGYEFTVSATVANTGEADALDVIATLSIDGNAALVGADGLGKPVVRALNSVNIAMGFEAGLAIVIVAIVLDRILKQPEGKEHMGV